MRFKVRSYFHNIKVQGKTNKQTNKQKTASAKVEAAEDYLEDLAEIMKVAKEQTFHVD